MVIVVIEFNEMGMLDKALSKVFISIEQRPGSAISTSQHPRFQ